MKDYNEVFVGLDVTKDRHAVAIAESGRDGEVRYLGEISSDGASVRRLVRKLARPGLRLRFCYEAGPTGYGLKLQAYRAWKEQAVFFYQAADLVLGISTMVTSGDLATSIARIF